MGKKKKKTITSSLIRITVFTQTCPGYFTTIVWTAGSVISHYSKTQTGRSHQCTLPELCLNSPPHIFLSSSRSVSRNYSTSFNPWLLLSIFFLPPTGVPSPPFYALLAFLPVLLKKNKKTHTKCVHRAQQFCPT